MIMKSQPTSVQLPSPGTDQCYQKPEYLFYKTMRHGVLSFDILIVSKRKVHKRSDIQQVSIGNIVPGTTEGVYIHNCNGVIRELKSLARVTFRTRNLAMSEARACYAPKTCAFLAHRSEAGLQILKLCLSGDKLRPHRPAIDNFGLCSRRWTKHVKTLAQVLGVNMRTFYDGHGRQASEEDRGNWAAAHCEKKLTAFAVHAFLQHYDIPRNQITLQTLAQLKSRLEHESTPPLELEVHVSRGPCGMPKRSGTCVKFVERLGRACGITFSIVFFEDGSNLIIDESMPPQTRCRTKKHRRDTTIGPADVYNSEEEDFLAEYPDNLSGVSPVNGCDLTRDEDQESTQANNDAIIDLDLEIIPIDDKDSEDVTVTVQSLVSHGSRDREKRVRASQQLHEARGRTPKAKRLRGDDHQRGYDMQTIQNITSPVQMEEVGCRQFNFCWHRGFCLCSSPLGSQLKDPSSWMEDSYSETP
ncbi:hypothetical protein CKAH01_05228 [Colletotrichum kahawae]|uniref:Uncharacterized protein n=1 Tax=Colletotrichum kahawae TaxID=34407 RepID=A0AAE0D746_COLKA|nr:hypothetical protein CKAH01_05228 [Colletotrichum kahawae]